MGLADDIYKAMAKASGGPDGEKGLDETQKKNLKTLGVDLSKAFTDFLIKQPLNITKTKAILEIEELSTSSPLYADVLSTLKVKPGISVQVDPNTGVGQTIQPGDMVGTKNAVEMKPLDLKKQGGDSGGVTTSKGYAYIGQNPIDAAETAEELTEIKLLEENIVEN